jgi:hypothetical protein
MKTLKNKDKGPLYTVEVFTKKGTDYQECKDHILETTFTVPGIYDNGTHYVTHMRLRLEILKKLNDFDYVLGIMGDYTGSNPSMGPIHDIGDFQKRCQEIDDRKEYFIILPHIFILMIISEMVKVVTVLLYNLNYHMESDGYRCLIF